MKNGIVSLFAAMMVSVFLVGCGISSNEPIEEVEEYYDETEAGMLDAEFVANEEMDESFFEEHLDDVDEGIAADIQNNIEEDKGSLTNSTLNGEAKNILASLETDYNKIYWGVTYPVDEELPGFVISVTPYQEGEQTYLIVGLTNLYDINMDFSGSVGAYDSSNNIIGDSFIYERNIGSGNTITEKIFCDGVPDGRLHWEEVKLTESSSDSKYVPWEIDYAIKGNAENKSLDMSYEIYSANNEDMSDIDLQIYLVTADGFIIADTEEYISDTIKAGSKYSATRSIYVDEALVSEVAGVAIFGNPVMDVE